MAEAPCKDCEKKGCGAYHDKCPEYLAFKEQHKKEKEERQSRIKVEMDYRTMTIEKALKRKKDLSRLKQR